MSAGGWLKKGWSPWSQLWKTLTVLERWDLNTRAQRENVIYFTFFMVQTTSVNPKTPEFICKKMCIYLYILKLQSSSKYSAFDAIHLSRHFFYTAQNSFWTARYWCLLVLLFSVSPLPQWQNISLEDVYHLGKQKKIVTQGEIRWIGRMGHRGHAGFSEKLLNTHRGVGRYACKSSIMKWMDDCIVRVFKKIHWSWTQPLTITPAGALIQMGS